MSRLIPLHLVPALIAAAAPAVIPAALAGAEITVEAKPFTIEQTFSATALPTEPQLIRLDAKEWVAFDLAHITAHGTKVKAGDVLFRFENDDFAKKLHDAREAMKARGLAIDQAELDFKSLQETTPIKLEALRRAALHAKEELDYFTETRRAADEEGAAQRLLRSEQVLANQREELSQLTKMYEADDLTEETEEIILERQRAAVAAAEFALRMEILNNERTLKVLIPREAEKLVDAERAAAHDLAKAEEELPRALEIKRGELAAAKTAAAREKTALANLEADQALLEIKAPADGWFYHGVIEDGRWTVGEIAKLLVVGGRLPVKRPVATFIPASSSLGLVAFLDEQAARSLSAGLSGTAMLAGREDLEIPVTLTSLATVPGPDNKYRADLEATWPKGFSAAPGTTVEVRTVSYRQENAVSLPTKALSFGAGGWTVEIKLADGKTEHRKVKRGRVSGEATEILSGVEPGQVVLVP